MRSPTKMSPSSSRMGPAVTFADSHEEIPPLDVIVSPLTGTWKEAFTPPSPNTNGDRFLLGTDSGTPVSPSPKSALKRAPLQLALRRGYAPSDVESMIPQGLEVPEDAVAINEDPISPEVYLPSHLVGEVQLNRMTSTSLATVTGLTRFMEEIGQPLPRAPDPEFLAQSDKLDEWLDEHRVGANESDASTVVPPGRGRERTGTTDLSSLWSSWSSRRRGSEAEVKLTRRESEEMPIAPPVLTKGLSVPARMLSGCTTTEYQSPVPALARTHTTRLRIIAISDVYSMENFAQLKTCFEQESAGFHPDNVIRVLSGDFLAPSLLSSLDSGYAMVKLLNQLKVDIVIFGNHDGNDIAYDKLVHRINEFKGTWLNTNMPDFEPALPTNLVRKLTSEDGTEGAREVAFLGLLMGGPEHAAMYRDDAFGGAGKSITPVEQAAVEAVAQVRLEHPDVDEIIALTHQDLKADRLLAGKGLFPVIIGGHDHDRTVERFPGRCPLVKPGMDATHAAIVDMVWPNSRKDLKPFVDIDLKDVNDYASNSLIKELVTMCHRPIKELEAATLTLLDEGVTLTSENSRRGDVSLATFFASAVRDCLKSNAAVINSGGIRGNKIYTKGISYGDIKTECPFPSAMVVVQMPFEVLREGIRQSRKPWWDKLPDDPPKEAASALQVDDGLEVDENHNITSIENSEPDLDELYAVAVDSYVLRKNVVFKEYIKQYPQRLPPDDSGRPVVPILIEYFCGEVWRKLISSAASEVMSRNSLKAFQLSANLVRCVSSDPYAGNSPLRRRIKDDVIADGARRVFKCFDKEDHGELTVEEFTVMIRERLGAELCSGVVVEQLVQMVDDGNGVFCEREIEAAIRKLAPAA